MEDTSNLNPCELGTKEFWDTAYETEINNYLDNGDTGEIWFDESSQTRIIKWLKNQKLLNDKVSLLDIGTGNGMMLIELHNEGLRNLTGIDYSENSIELAKKIANDQEKEIEYKLYDILKDSVEDLGKFMLCHDKGTYDAIGLSEDSTEKLNTYVKNVSLLLKDEGFFIITSCNFTENELLNVFSMCFEKFDTIPTQTFQFGGKIGNKTSSIVLKKKSKS